MEYQENNSLFTLFIVRCTTVEAGPARLKQFALMSDHMRSVTKNWNTPSDSTCIQSRPMFLVLKPVDRLNIGLRWRAKVSRPRLQNVARNGICECSMLAVVLSYGIINMSQRTWTAAALA